MIVLEGSTSYHAVYSQHSLLAAQFSITIRGQSPASQLQLALTDDGGGVEVVPVFRVTQDHLQLGEGLQQAVLTLVLPAGEHA